MDPVQAARMLAQRLPHGAVWYGVATGRFWAIRRGFPHIEALTPEEMEAQAWALEQRFHSAAPRQRVAPVARNAAQGRWRHRRRTAGAVR
ncbi:hypothetical protein ACIBH1_40820 [Nonomuraea sp. NPDC050663]|uniref:hypothetical protein n=1 Tax=Nonomuraea sp. NPDC050663 TaxID=3364370 RepID=UPI003799C661